MNRLKELTDELLLAVQGEIDGLKLERIKTAALEAENRELRQTIDTMLKKLGVRVIPPEGM